MRRVVVTGIGIISPLGIGSKAHWEALLAGQSGVRQITSLDPAGFATHIAGEAPAYKIADFVPRTYRKATKVMARDIELAIVAADDAFKDAGLQSQAYTQTPNFDGRRFGCNIGAGLINAELNELTAAMNTARSPSEPNRLDMARWGKDGMTQLTPLWLLKYLPNMLACHVTIIHQLKGPSNTITCADASSHLAIGEAFRTIQRGNADLAICGGADRALDRADQPASGAFRCAQKGPFVPPWIAQARQPPKSVAQISDARGSHAISADHRPAGTAKITLIGHGVAPRPFLFALPSFSAPFKPRARRRAGKTIRHRCTDPGKGEEVQVISFKLQVKMQDNAAFFFQLALATNNLHFPLPSLDLSICGLPIHHRG